MWRLDDLGNIAVAHLGSLALYCVEIFGPIYYGDIQDKK